MSDAFVLHCLSRPRNVAGTDYVVAWDCEKNVCVICTIGKDGKLRDLLDSNNVRFEFSCEIEAYRYLNGLFAELEGEVDEKWKTL